MAEYALPDLPYDYGALEPHYSGEIVELHHDKHHAAYVAGANSTLDRLAEARDNQEFGSIVGLEKTLAFNVSGHVLHSIFWTNLSPDGGDRPTGELAAAIMTTSGPSMDSSLSSPTLRLPSRGPDGAHWLGSLSANNC
jgi:Fe-Mn family superoxide dismutase